MALDPVPASAGMTYPAGMTGSLNFGLISKSEGKDTQFMHQRSEAKPR